MSGLDFCMLMTDQVHLAAQREAEFTLAPRSFSLSLYSLTFLFHHLLISFSRHSYSHFLCVREYVCKRGEGEGNRAIMFLTFLSHSAMCVWLSVFVWI